MRTALSHVLTLGLLLMETGLAQETQTTAAFPDTEYISGKAGLAEKVKGQLIIRKQEIVFADKKGKALFTLPMNIVASASNETETDPGSFGRKAVLGVFASKREEYLTVRTESTEGAEAIVFKCKKKTSDAMVTKIDFFRKKLKAS